MTISKSEAESRALNYVQGLEKDGELTPLEVDNLELDSEGNWLLNVFIMNGLDKLGGAYVLSVDGETGEVKSRI